MFSCTWRQCGVDTAWVRPIGELDLATVPTLDEALTAALACSRLTTLDLSGLSFLDVAGVHLIVDTCASAFASGRRLTVIPAAAHLQRLFTLTGTNEALEMDRNARQTQMTNRGPSGPRTGA